MNIRPRNINYYGKKKKKGKGKGKANERDYVEVLDDDEVIEVEDEEEKEEEKFDEKTMVDDDDEDDDVEELDLEDDSEMTNQKLFFGAYSSLIGFET